jgi:phage terminase large subunit-like protein
VAEYRPATCADCDTDSWCETRANGKPQCRACKVERFFAEILYPPLGSILLGWLRLVLRDIYGTVRAEDGLRRYRSAYISVAKKNGKSFLIGGLPLYHLLMEGERNPEAYGAAAAKDQAGLVFKAAVQLVAANSDLSGRLKVLPSTKKILRKDGGGFYAVLSADGDLQDGIEPSLAIRDEVHRWKTTRAETLRDVIVKGQISREEPLDIGITTAGAEYESPLWWRDYQFAKSALTGSPASESFYAAIWEADANRVASEPEYWKSRDVRVAANPSHEDLGGFLKDTAIVAELDKAIAEPAERSKYLRYHLNVPLKTQEDPIIDMYKWELCGGGIDLRQCRKYNVDSIVDAWNLRNRLCFAGVDASWTTDLTAVVFVFPPFDRGDAWTLLPFFWLPAKKVVELERVCRVPFETWVEQGFVTATPGSVIDQRSVMDRVRWGNQRFDMQEMPFDRYNFRTEALNLADEGIVAVEVQQTFLYLSHPTKFLLGAYLEQNIRHGNHPVLNWMASCLQLHYDHKDNCQPTKPEPGRWSPLHWLISAVPRSAAAAEGIASVAPTLAHVAADKPVWPCSP